jgi:hypothetical protein
MLLQNVSWDLCISESKAVYLSFQRFDGPYLLKEVFLEHEKTESLVALEF